MVSVLITCYNYTMKNFLKYLSSVVAGALFVSGLVYGATILFVNGGGTGWGLPGGLKAHSVLVGNGLGQVSTTSPGSSGQVLTSNGANADPTFQDATGGSSAYPFPLLPNSTSTTVGFFSGLFSNSSTTINTKLLLPFLSSGVTYIGSNSQLASAATTTCPTFSTGLSYSGTAASCIGGTNGNVTVNTSQSITVLSNLTNNGFVQTSGGNGTLGVQQFPCTVAQGCTNKIAYPANSIITSDALGTTLIATTSDLTVSSLLATSTKGWSIFLNDGVQIGTSTPLSPFVFVVASSTAPQISLSAGAGFSQWVLRNGSGEFALATSSIDGLSTTSISALTVSSSGFGTTTVTGLNITGQATSTSNVGINITSGCFAFNKVCISGSGGGSGTVTSITNGVGTVNNGTSYTTSGTITSSFASTTQNPTIGRVPMYVSTGSGGTSILLVDTATSSLTATSPIAVSNAPAILGSSGAVITCTTCITTYDAWTHPFGWVSATTSSIEIGTTTISVNQSSTLTLSSTTSTQLGLFNGAGVNGVTLRNAGGNLYISTTTVDGLSTTTVPALTILTGNGDVGVSTSTPTANLAVNAPAQTQPYFLIGSTTSTVLSVSPATSVGGTWSFGSTTPAARFAIHALYQDTFNPNLFMIASSSNAATSTVFQITNIGTIFAPNTSSSGGAQTGYWCYDTAGQLIRDTVVCIAVSAARFKFAINYTPEYGLEELLKLKPVTYKLKPDYNVLFPNDPNYNGVQYGLIADDVQKIDSHLVTVETSTTTFEGITYPPGTVHGLADTSAWAGFFTKSIQDLNAKIEHSKRSVEENWQWFAVGLLALWNLYLTFKKRT